MSRGPRQLSTPPRPPACARGPLTPQQPQLGRQAACTVGRSERDGPGVRRSRGFLVCSALRYSLHIERRRGAFARSGFRTVSRTSDLKHCGGRPPSLLPLPPWLSTVVEPAATGPDEPLHAAFVFLEHRTGWKGIWRRSHPLGSHGGLLQGVSEHGPNSLAEALGGLPAGLG